MDRLAAEATFNLAAVGRGGGSAAGRRSQS